MVYKHEHGSLPSLTWASDDNEQLLSKSLTTFLEYGLLAPDFHMGLDGVNEDILSQISSIDFRYWDAWDIVYLIRLCRFVSLSPLSYLVLVVTCIQDPSTSIVRVEPSSPLDYQLLEYFNLVIGNGIAKPAKFPLRRVSPFL